jgi:transcriptional regulator with XRE-family HTH domain
MTDAESKLPSIDSRAFVQVSREHKTLISQANIIGRLRRGRVHRATYLNSNLDRELAYQLRRLRDKMGWSQPELAKKMGTSQNAISRLESLNYGKASLSTLKKLAAMYDVALDVRFIPFTKWAKWQSSTPYIETGLSPDSNNPKTFTEEENQGLLDRETENISIGLNRLIRVQPLSSQAVLFQSVPSQTAPLRNLEAIEPQPASNPMVSLSLAQGKFPSANEAEVNRKDLRRRARKRSMQYGRRNTIARTATATAAA